MMLSDKPPRPRKAVPAASHFLAASAITGQGQSLLPKRNKSRLRARPAQLKQKNRFASRDGGVLGEDAVRFGAAMQAYLGSRNRAGWTAGEALDVLMGLGWKNKERDFEVNVHRFATAIAALKRGTRGKAIKPFPTFSEILAVAVSLGWYLAVNKGWCLRDKKE